MAEASSDRASTQNELDAVLEYDEKLKEQCIAKASGAGAGREAPGRQPWALSGPQGPWGPPGGFGRGLRTHSTYGLSHVSTAFVSGTRASFGAEQPLNAHLRVFTCWAAL